MNPNFFKNLKNINTFLENAFELLTEKKIEKFDPITISNLLNVDQE